MEGIQYYNISSNIVDAFLLIDRRVAKKLAEIFLEIPIGLNIKNYLSEQS